MKSAVKIALVFVALLAGSVYAQSAQKPTPPPAAAVAPAPEVSQEQKLTVGILAQRLDGNQTKMQLLQAQAQLLQIDNQKATDELEKVFASLQKDGYELDRQTLTYKKK